MSKKIWVLKYGTESLSEDGVLCQKIFDLAAEQMAYLIRQGIAIVVVTSGAIRAGREGLAERGVFSFSIEDKKILAGIGARRIENMWDRAFEKHGIPTIGMRLTYSNWRDSTENANMREVIYGSVRNGIVPVINENDVVSPKEIISMEKGISENDQLGYMIAGLIKADTAVYNTHTKGVYDRNPTIYSNARLYRVLGRERMRDISWLDDVVSRGGRGGMTAKVLCAYQCYEQGTLAIIMHSREPNGLIRLHNGEDVGTRLGEESVFYEDDRVPECDELCFTSSPA